MGNDALRRRIGKEQTMATIEEARTRHFLRVSDLDADELESLLDLAADMREHPRPYRNALQQETVAMFFEQPSTRTRASFAAAAHRLGALPLALRPDELQLGRGEPIADTARVLSSYASAIVVRTFAQSELEEVAAFSSVPVINALSDAHHPCQALADLYTVRERLGSLAGRKLAFVGDGRDNVAHSLLEAGALTGLHVAVATPDDYAPAREIVETARSLAERTAAAITIHDQPRDAVADADAVYTDVWVSMGEEGEREQRLRALAPFQVDAELMHRAKPEAIFLHCLPAHRGEEVTAEVIDGAQSAVWQQAANRLPTEQALLYGLVTGSWRRADD
jgi:ornithine carbamoyltransferase